MLNNLHNIFIVGIKGSAMANLARILSQMGKNVIGSDVEEVFITDEVLVKSNIKVIHSFEPKVLPSDTQLVIYSASHNGKDNAQVQEALKRGIQVKHQADVLGELIKRYKTSVAVCGCHGKTTTSALLSYALKNLGVNPGYMVGTSGFNNSYGGEMGTDEYFVIEADEYGLNPPSNKTPKLNYLKPTHAICTNIDFDHPDVYETIDEVKKTFRLFFNKTISGISNARLLFCGDDKNLLEVAAGLSRNNYFTFGFSHSVDLQIIKVFNDEDKTIFQLKNNGVRSLTEIRHNDVLQITVTLFGDKNISNAAGVILFLLTQGFDPTEINTALQGFTGAKRRFELVAKVNDSYLFDDYAHHPEEIEATIKAARKRFPNRRILVLFQPHTYSRTESLKDEFVQALSFADGIFIAPIFPSAREKVQKSSITSKDLEQIAKEKKITHLTGFNSKQELVEAFKGQVKQGDIIFTMGAGDIYKMKDRIIEQMTSLDH